MSAGAIVTWVILFPLVFYVVVRLGAAAFFKSKQTYDQQRKDHGQQTPRLK